MLWCSWLGGRKGIRPVKNWVVGCWHGYLSAARCRHAYGQLMPLSLTVSCVSKIQIGFTFLVPAHLGSPGQRAVKQVCVWIRQFRWNWIRNPFLFWQMDHALKIIRPAESKPGLEQCTVGWAERFGLDRQLWLDTSHLHSPGCHMKMSSNNLRESTGTTQAYYVSYLLFCECCSRCRLQPYDCVIIRFVDKIQSAIKFC